MMRLFLITGLFISNVHAFTLISGQSGWSKSNLAINVNRTNCPSDIKARLQESINLWNSVATSGLKLRLGNLDSTTTPSSLAGGTASDVPVIVCDSQFSTTLPNSGSGVAGVGFFQLYQGGYGGVILNTQSGMNGDINAVSTAIRSTVIAHEMGHMLGLGHSGAASSLMYYSAGVKSVLSLSKDDWDGISYLYPRDEFENSDQFAGCALVKNQTPNSTSPWIAITLLLLPLLIYAHLRKRNCST